MNNKWRSMGYLHIEPDRKTKITVDNFCLAIIGPAGTGKTAVLKLTEALIIFFAGLNTVQKLAPSNTAARLLGGDTLHALCKLPFGGVSLSSKQGKLRKLVLQNLRRKWKNTITAFIDEISMVPSDQLLQVDVRLRQAKMQSHKTFGNLAMNVCGDFLQLPPVDKHGTRPSLAKPIDSVGQMDIEDAAITNRRHMSTITSRTMQDKQDNKIDDDDDNNKQEAHVEARQGFDIWRSITRVVCLNVNIRAPDALGRFQAEMRAGEISDDMWNLYLSRIIKPHDSRLSDPKSPFVMNDIHFIVHRHRIRVTRSFMYAQQKSIKLQTPLYMLQALDEVVRTEDAPKVTPQIRVELLRKVNPEYTKGFPSFLPLFLGMRLLLSSKDCVRFGIVKGCICTLKHIVFADEETLPFELLAGHAHELKYMPVSLILQADDVQWTLPESELPACLPPDLDRRGLFQLRPSHDYISQKIGDEYVSFRRTSFRMTPADTITVYAAQGSTFDAVIADMKRPYNEALAKNWLACYVMLSRARSIDGFLILRPATREELSTKPPQYLIDELQRLADLESTTLQDLMEYINNLDINVPSHIEDVLKTEAPIIQEMEVKSIRTRNNADHISLKNTNDVSSTIENVATRKRLRTKTKSSEVPWDTTGVLVQNTTKADIGKLSRENVVMSPDARDLRKTTTTEAGLSKRMISDATIQTSLQENLVICGSRKTAATREPDEDDSRLPKDLKLSSSDSVGIGDDSTGPGSPDYDSADRFDSDRQTTDPPYFLSFHANQSTAVKKQRELNAESMIAVVGKHGTLHDSASIDQSQSSAETAFLSHTGGSRVVDDDNDNDDTKASGPGAGAAIATGIAAGLVVAGVSTCRGSPMSLDSKVRAAAASAAEKRIREMESRGICDIEKVRRMQSTCTQSEGGDVFGACRRFQLRANVEKLRREAETQPAATEIGFSNDVATSTLPTTVVSQDMAENAEGIQPPQTSSSRNDANLNESYGGSLISSRGCSKQNHTCPFDESKGCPSCFRTCHDDCSSELCEVMPCPQCFSVSVATCYDSPLCIEIQNADGCHACHRVGCWSSCNSCPKHKAEPSAVTEGIPFQNEKPRAFYNMMRERLGGGSCWINSALQVLLSPMSIKVALGRHWQSLNLTMQQQLLRRIGNAGEAPVILNNQDRLAATFYSVNMPPRTEPLFPYLFTDSFYNDDQDDAQGFITRVLYPRAVPTLWELIRGRMDQCLECADARCGFARESEGENFGSLQLPLRTAQNTVVQTVQQALDGYMPDEMVELNEPCRNCKRSNIYWKRHKISHYPHVLIISLNRWDGVREEDALLHSIAVTETVRFRDITYNLCGVVCHLGLSPHGGHYVAVTRHVTNNGEWWLYDDNFRVIASMEQVRTTCSYQDWGPMQSYVCFYEKRGQGNID